MATKVMNGLDLQSQRVQNVATPTTSTDAANKAYVDALQSGLSWKDEVRAATTTNGTLSTAYANGQTVDGYVLVTGDRILLKNQTTQTDNGIYTVNASGAPTRATDANTTASLNNATVFVTKGTVNADTSWTQQAADPTIGSTNITFVQYGAGQTYTAGNGLQLSSNAFSVLPNGTSIDVAGAGIKVSQSAAGNGIAISTVGVVSVNNGTGITFNGSALTTDHSIIPQKFSATVGDGSTTAIVVTHNLGTRDVSVTVYDASTFAVVLPDVAMTTTNTVTVTFAVAPASNAYRVVVMG